jgi:hypothetical protein
MQPTVWGSILERTRDAFQDIIRKVKNSEKVVDCSWRYHATFVKAMETLLDCEAADATLNHEK